MLTVPEVVEKIVRRSRYLSEALSKGIINVSALSVYMKPEVEELLKKPVSKPSIMMALRRMHVGEKPRFVDYHRLFQNSTDLTVRSNLVALSFANADTLIDKFSKLTSIFKRKDRHFFTFTQGNSDLSIIVTRNLVQEIERVLKDEMVISNRKNLSAITLQLPKEVVDIPGIYYFFLKSLAWDNINIIEIVSTTRELTMVFEEKDVERAFSILKSLLTQRTFQTMTTP